MPGIAGCFCLATSEPTRSPDDIVAKIQRVNDIPGVACSPRKFCSDQIVIVNLLTGHLKQSVDQPATDSDGRYILFLEGEVCNLEDIAESNGDKTRTGACATLLNLYVTYGPDFVTRLRGQFNILIYDATAARLNILNDGFGSKSMYYQMKGKTLYFGSEKKSILALMEEAPRIDPVGLLQVFSHLHNLGSRTFIQDLHSLPAGTMLEAVDGKIRCSSTSYYSFPTVAHLGANEAIERWCELLRTSARQRIAGKERIALQLSGGLDSRAIACALDRDQRSLVAITREVENAREVECARAVAQELGIEHHPFTAREIAAHYIPAIVWRSECTISYSHCRSIANHVFLKRHADFLIGGQFGDISSGGHIAPYMLEAEHLAGFARHVFQNYSVGYESLQHFFNRQFLDEYLPQVEHEFCASFNDIHEENNANAYQVWDQRERQANFILRAGLVDRHLFDPIYPFLDVDYYDFVRSLPPKWRIDQAMYRAVICRLGPEVRKIPNANDGLTLHPTPLVNAMKIKARRSYGRWRNRVVRRVSREQRGARKLARDSQAAPKQLDHLIRRFIGSDDFDDRLFCRQGITRVLDAAAGKIPRRDELLQQLATFAVGIPMFANTTPRECPGSAIKCLTPSESDDYRC